MTIHLSIVLWLPLACGVLALALPSRAGRWLAVLGSLAVLAYAIVLAADYETARGGLQYVTDETWIRSLGIHYKLGITGLNLFLIVLTAVTFCAANLWVALKQDLPRAGLYALLMGLAESAVLGAFLAQDLALFVVFFDLMLVPFLFLTLIWGGPDRSAAVLKLFIYTLVGSLLMLVGAIATGVLAASASGNHLSFVLSDLRALPALDSSTQDWIFLVFAAAFLIKMPAFPFHGWMPDGYMQMPIPVLAVFSAVLSKVAAYGFIQIALPLFPDAAVHFQVLLMLLALGSILYGSAMAFSSSQARLILGYSSVAQLGFITLGIFALNQRGVDGALLQSVTHGLVTAPMILIVALLAKRAGGSEDLRDMGGIAFRAPVLAAVFLIFTLALLAMPGSANFIAEFFILLGAFQSKIAIGLIASVGVGMAAVYALRLYMRSMHNRVGPLVESREMSLRDGLVLVPMLLALLAFSLYPQVAMKRAERDVKATVAVTQAAQANGDATVAARPSGETAR